MTKSLAELLENYQFIRLATESDNEEILSFLKTIPMQMDSFDLRYDRGMDFFSFFPMQAKKCFTFLFLQKDGAIGGLSVMAIRDSWSLGNRKTSGYLSDLRLSPNLYKRARVEWRRFYADLMKNAKFLEDLDRCAEFNSSILNENAAAMRSFTSGKSDVVYTELGQYSSFNLLKSIKLPVKLDRLLSMDKGTKNEINHFLFRQNKGKLFGQYFTEDQEDVDGEWARRKKFWPRFKAENFIVIKKDGKTVATCLPWSAGDHRKMIVDKAKLQLKIVGKLLPLFGRKGLNVGDELRIAYLTHLEFCSSLTEDEKKAALALILKEVDQRKTFKEFHLVNLFSFQECFITKVIPTSSPFVEEVKATLFQVYHRDHADAPEIISTPVGQEMSFELGVS